MSELTEYVRHPQACMRFVRGLKADVSGALLLMIDLMVIHVDESDGIPAEPVAYIAGLLGVGQRKWNQVIEPALLDSKRVRKIKRNGIMVYRFPDEQMSGEKALFRRSNITAYRSDPPIRPAQNTHEEATERGEFYDPDAVKAETAEAEMTEYLAAGDDVADLVRAVDDAKPFMADPIVQQLNEAVADLPTPTPPPVETPAVEVPPATHTAYDVLKRAGISVEDHPRGQFFWARSDHNTILDQWLKVVPLNEVVARIDRARQANQIPEVQNTLAAFEQIVLGE